ncbi:chemotaxis protein CheA [Methanoculleus sp. FWC-SCC1]|uniref:Chemotaxis protein CheA n=1 Tax=Methanoculleus frigidifontis TaxID=2584085 RepID=A0ABT8M656_9EURY|nr:chemotaxis protein CheA [Methanoculleus sp. FWC-SCC1]MDN7023390.1 chemotaxis protein CheA [Methanoculleus sp. FWC-SCC1]
MLDEEIYRKLFVEESRENHETIVNSLLALEHGEDAAAIDEIFRSAHTLKGMSASMGFDDMERLCHSMEDVFQLVRNGQRTVTPALTDLLLRCTDVIEVMLDEIEGGGDPSSETAEILIKSLKAFSDKGTDEAAFDALPDGGGADAEPAMIPVAMEDPDADASPVYTLRITLDPACGMKDVRALVILQNLEELGSIRATTPSRDLIEDGMFGESFSLRIASDAGEEALKTVASGADVTAVEVSLYEQEAAAADADPRPDLEFEDIQAPQKPGKSEKAREIKNIRVDIHRLDQMMNLVEDLVINRGRLEQIARKHGIKEFDEALSMVGRSVSDLQNLMMGIRMIPLERIFNRLPRVVRDVANYDGKEVEFIVDGGDTELDRSMMDGLNDPLLHIIRNAVNHGIEPPDVREANGKPRKGLLKLVARRDKDNVIIEIEDDGSGIDPEKLRHSAVEKGLMTAEAARTAQKEELIGLLFQPGFSTAEKITDISGRGVGLDVVKRAIESLKGTIRVDSTLGKGTTFELVLPPTMAIVDVMMVHINDRRCAIPVSNVVEVATGRQDAIHHIGSTETILLRDSLLPMHRLEDMFGASSKGSDTLVVLQNDGKKCCIVVDSVEGQQEVVVKPLSRLVGSCRGISGVTIPGDGDVVPVLDVNTMV